MTQETALAIKQSNTIIRSFDDAERAAAAMAKSGYFSDSRDAAQAVVKILAGQEMGFGAFAAMSGIHIIQGRPAIGANLMAAAVKRSGRYNYRVTEMTDKVCTIKFYEHGEEIGVSSFTLEDAKKAGTKNLDKFPRNMLFARAMSNGVRWYCPDVFSGATVYTPEELGAEVDEEGNMINGQFTDAPAPKKTVPPPTRSAEEIIEDMGYYPQPAAVAAAVEQGGEVRETKQEQPAAPKPPARTTGSKQRKQFDPKALRNMLLRAAEEKYLNYPCSPENRQAVVGCLNHILGGDAPRKELIKYLTGISSTKELSDAYMLALHGWLKPSYDENLAAFIATDEVSVREAAATHREALLAAGQQELI